MLYACDSVQYMILTEQIEALAMCGLEACACCNEWQRVPRSRRKAVARANSNACDADN